VANGIDAQPCERFDANGDYVRRWVPELARLPNAVIHRPWEASPAQLLEAGVRLEVEYPYPIVDLKRSRDEALAAYATIKSVSQFGGDSGT
jgi:deoxyribodipyrimidine photo-lyase